jgi:hypothetical protein
MMKLILLAVVAFLAFGGGAWRTRRLWATLKRLPSDFTQAKAQALDPVRHAKDVTPPSSTTKTPPTHEPKRGD